MAKNLNAESYSSLLKAFAADEISAAASYTKLRESLVRFFQIKGDETPEESADETLDRVAAKVGENVLIENLTKYAFGTARLVFLENLRRSAKQKKAFENFSAENDNIFFENDADEFQPLRECFESLPEPDKNILREYFADLRHGELNENRRKLTIKFDISLNNLRLKIFRLRRRLADCVREKIN